MSLIPCQRDSIILDMLRQHGAITVEEIATHCNCSPMSVRRDLRRLEEQGLLKRTHGGAASIVRDASPNSLVAVANTLETRTALLDRSDVLIVTPTRTLAMDLLVGRARRAGVPIIAESINYQGAATAVAIDDYGAGQELGYWVGNYVQAHRSDAVQVLAVGVALPNTEARDRGFSDGLRGVLGNRHTLFHVDGQGLRKAACDAVAGALAMHPAITVIFGINDDSALGALDAYRAAGLDESALILVSCGLEGNATKDLLMGRGPYKAALAMFPELVGRACIDAALCAYHGCALPERLVMPHAIITADTLADYYELDECPGAWRILPAAFRRLLGRGQGLPLLEECSGRARPSRVGVVQVYTSHEWYQNMRRAMQARCQSLDIRLEVIDASHDLAQEVDQLNRAIGRAAAHFVAEGDTIILDSGKATTYLAAALHKRKGITVITNSLTVLAELADEPGVRLLASGGLVRSGARSLIGRGAEDSFNDLRATKAFVTGAGFSLDFGLSSASTSELGVRQAIVKAAREVILLADHTVIGVEALVKVAPVESIHRLVTDAGISAHDRLAITQRGIEVTLAED